jgi:hypothetical protein
MPDARQSLPRLGKTGAAAWKESADKGPGAVAATVSHPHGRPGTGMWLANGKNPAMRTIDEPRDPNEISCGGAINRLTFRDEIYLLQHVMYVFIGSAGRARNYKAFAAARRSAPAPVAADYLRSGRTA